MTADQIIKALREDEFSDADLAKFRLTIGGSANGDAPVVKSSRFTQPVKASEVRSKPIKWLWPGFIPSGAYTLLSGEEGTGKSTLAYRVIAEVTTGGFEHPPADVALFAYEDAAAQVVIPRLKAVGADLDRVHIYGIKNSEDGIEEDDSMLTLPDDLPAFKYAADQMDNLRLVVIDPIVDVLADELNENSNKNVRSALQPLQKWAESADIAVLGIGHLNKSHTRAANKSMGSKAWRTVARSQLLYGPNPEDRENPLSRGLAVSKTNYSAKKSVVIDVQLVEIEHEGGRISTEPAANIGAAATFTDDDLTTAIVGTDSKGAEPSKLDQAKNCILGFLDIGGGRARIATVYEGASSLEIPERTLRRARDELGVERDGNHWILPDDLPEI